MTSGNPAGTALVPAEAQGWTTSHRQDQDHPQLVVQNLTFADGNSTGELTEGGGGGAIFVRGGRFRVVSQYQNLPVYVVNSTFGGGSSGAPATPGSTVR